MRAALRAEYGIDLRDVMTRRTMSPVDLADHVAWLPAGCAFWRDVGGPASLTQEVHALRGLEFRVRELIWIQTKDAKDGKNRPKPPEDPPWAHERVKRAAAPARKVEAYLERQRRRSEVGDS